MSTKLCIGALLVASAASGCRTKATQDQCNALADHLHKLMTEAKLPKASGSKNMTSHQRDRFVMVCVRDGSQPVVECMLGSGTWDELVKTCGPMVR